MDQKIQLAINNLYKVQAEAHLTEVERQNAVNSLSILSNAIVTLTSRVAELEKVEEKKKVEKDEK